MASLDKGEKIFRHVPLFCKKVISLPRINQPKYLVAMAYKIDPESCVSCGTCIGECPVEAISEGTPYTINPDLCAECGSCADSCPNDAIHPE